MRHVLILLFCALSFYAQAQRTDTISKNSRMTVKQFAGFSAEYNRLQKQMKLLEAQRLEIDKKLKQHDSTLKAVNLALEKWERQANAAGGNSQSQLLNATQQMQETQMSFNLQYLQLQSQMQHENRSYTAISNIMKTKHDTAKNSISNIR